MLPRKRAALAEVCTLWLPGEQTDDDLSAGWAKNSVMSGLQLHTTSGRAPFYHQWIFITLYHSARVSGDSDWINLGPNRYLMSDVTG